MEFRLPDLGEGIDEAEIVRWLVQPGERVTLDQPVAQVQTDKALVDLPSPAAGVIVSLGPDEGARVRVGTVLFTLDADGAVQQGIVGTLPGEEPIGDSVAAPATAPATAPAPAQAPTPAPAAGLPPAATPATRRLARELGVNLTTVTGTGPGGRITDADVRGAVATPAQVPTAAAPAKSPAPTVPAPAAPTVIPIRGLRRRIAERMEEAARIPRVTVMEEADAHELAALLDQLRPAAEEAGVRLSYLPILCKLAMAALRRHPRLNAHYDATAGEIRTFAAVDLGIATATGDGLLVPVIRGAQRMNLLELASAIVARAQGARQRTLAAEQLRGSTFTITSPGPQGGIFATPLLNPPEVAILGIGRIGRRAVVRDGSVQARAVLPFSLTFDHRALDGADAGEFVATFARYVAAPGRLLLEL